MKLTDYVVDFLRKEGIGHVFGVTGGAVVHLFDSVSKNPGTTPVFNHHEQASALAAQAYARIHNGLGAVFVTTGPGGTNAITGLCAAWLDSIPCVFISGQSRIEHSSRGKGLRQVGTQELDIVSVVTSLTKYAVMVDDPKRIKYYLEKAVAIAHAGRPGPVWIDIPLNFQWADVVPEELAGFGTLEPDPEITDASLEECVSRCLEWLSAAKRPLVLAGYGIRLSHAEEEFKELVETLRLPFVSSWNASDILPTNHPFYVGRPGIAGQRGANLAVQNCDLLLAVGSHLAIPLTGTMTQAFAGNAKKIVVDIDPVELRDRPVRVDLPVCCDAKRFLRRLLARARGASPVGSGRWREKCAQVHSRYNSIPPEFAAQKDFVNPYYFVERLSEELDGDDLIVVDGGGTVVYIAFQAFRVKEGQRITISSGLCAMGTGLPESIGACFAGGPATNPAGRRRRTICLIGDGSLQFNIQELQTIAHHGLPIKIFVFDNDGYLSIRHTQGDFLGKNYVGSDKSGGLSLPDVLEVAAAYGVPGVRVHDHDELNEKIRWALGEPGPALCEIMIARNQEVIPRLGFDKKDDGTYAPRPLEDMYPYLDRREFQQAMSVE